MVKFHVGKDPIDHIHEIEKVFEGKKNSYASNNNQRNNDHHDLQFYADSKSRLKSTLQLSFYRKIRICPSNNYTSF